MRVTVIGSGYVGLVTGACLSDLGFKVVCLDKDLDKIKMLQEGDVPIYEPGLKELLARNYAEGRIRYTTNAAEAIDHGDVLFIAVGTPPLEDGSADLAHVLSVASMIGCNMKSFKLIVNKSTVPVGTADRVRAVITHELAQRGMTNEVFDVISNPEFLKEGAAIDDFMRPDRIVIGVDAGIHHERSQRMMGDLYASFNRHHSRTVWMDVRSAELTKYAANAMLATRISFMNEIANLADVLAQMLITFAAALVRTTALATAFCMRVVATVAVAFQKTLRPWSKPHSFMVKPCMWWQPQNRSTSVKKCCWSIA